MTTKMKGLFKGIRYISQIFDDEDEQKEQDFQIGLPTDVKHVAHVGYDGPATDDSTSWMKGDSQSNKGDAEKSEDGKRGQRTKKSQQQGDGTKPSRRKSTDNNNLTDTSPPKRPSRRLSADNATAKPSRRSQAKDLPEGGGGGDVPKKTRRKKSESIEGGSRRPKCKAAAANGVGDTTGESGSDTAAQKPSYQSSEDEEREKIAADS